VCSKLGNVGKEVRAQPTKLAFSSFEDPTADMENNLEVATLSQRKDARAKAVIGLTLTGDHLEHIRNAKTAAEMWTALKNVFQRSSLLNKLAAHRRFYTVSIMEDEGILTYRVRQIAEELKSMDAKIDETEVAMAVLNGLPSKYDHLIVALDALGDDTKLTMEFT
jgi:gag-polypeptide of LTR copia-type